MFPFESAPSIPLVQSQFQPIVDGAQWRQANAGQLFPNARSAQGALAGVALRLQCWEAAHQIAQDIDDTEGAYWHAILHRIEPDSFNAGYWFRRVGQHELFPTLLAQAKPILQPRWPVPDRWQPQLFVEWAEEALRRDDRDGQQALIHVQMLEWQLLFDYCRQPRR